MNILVHVVWLMPEFYFTQIPMPTIPSSYLTERTLYLLQPLKKTSIIESKPSPARGFKEIRQ